MSAPERIWVDIADEYTRGAMIGNVYATDIGDEPYIRLDLHEAAVAAAQQREAGLLGLIRWAHETLWELNPNNYDHDEVCKVNDAAVEVILGLAPVIGETHGYSAEWWAERAALSHNGRKGE